MGTMVHLTWALRLVLGALVVWLAAAYFGVASFDGATGTSQAAGSLRSFVPVVPRNGLTRPVSFGMAVPGPGVALTGTPPSGQTAQSDHAEAPPYVDVQSFEVSYDGGLTFELLLGGDVAEAPPGFLAFDFIGRPGDVARVPRAMMEPHCQVSPPSDPQTFAVLFSGFPGNDLVDVRINQIGGDEVFDIARPVTIGPYGDGTTTFNFFSGQTKDWRVTGTARANRIISATTTFRTSVNEPCPPPPETSSIPPPPLSDGLDFFGNSSFNVRVARTDGAWGGELWLWDGQAWVRSSTFDDFSVSGTTVRMSVPPGDLGISGSCIQFGGLSRSFPAAGSAVGKPILLDEERGPLGSFCLEPDSGSLSSGGPGGGPIVVQAWIGCGGSHAGLVGPACSSSQAAGRSAATSHGATLIGVTSNGISPSSCTPSTVDATMCPPVGMDIWIAPDGQASLSPYDGYGLFTWVVTTSPPLANGSVAVAVLAEDYSRVVALRHLPMHLPANQALLGRYTGAWLPTGGAVSLDATGVGSHTYSGVEFARLYNHMVCDLKGLFTFSQLPLTFHSGGSANKFIIDIGVKYDPTYRCP